MTEKANRKDQFLSLFSPGRIAIPIVLGLGVSAFFVIKDFDINAYRQIDWQPSMAIWLFLALLTIVGRHGGYMYRIRLLSDNSLSWKRSFNVINLWEFASAVTPSIVGGTAAALYILTKEKINAGRSTAIVLVTAFLDELFFILFTPVVLLFIGFGAIFPQLDFTQGFDIISDSWILMSFLFGYLLLFAYTVFLAWGLFKNPRGLKWIIIKLFSFSFLKKYRTWAAQTGDEVIVASNEFRNKQAAFWAKAFASTVVSWISRYLLINFIIACFSIQALGLSDQLTILGRQLPLWIILLLPVSPGGAGVFEGVFPAFFNDYLNAGLVDSISLLIRLYSYYPYLILGTIVLPAWIGITHRKSKVQLN